MKEFNIRILKADNGWVICDQRLEGGVPEMRVIHEDRDLAGEVAAALVSDKLEGRTIQGYNNIESIERALVKLAKYERDEKARYDVAKAALAQQSAGRTRGTTFEQQYTSPVVCTTDCRTLDCAPPTKT